ncbi:Tripartite ATP-independent periplasmic transporter DctQ component [Caldalkalibacillus thermarum TA2.A1]|uniref:TRAP transporter small permease n=1 Tax=Caldalkalibacillus thermarum (strain TA2.A1) TaxID=986075 RepID=F5L9I3_CALTT|nr:TRAP transporter small permease [Caldalkalibacillus thermarum]EGL81970.1 Tripartite ATP-independent periplasmic transporter DctQ component [Caldalkalibacillus thermarum TA2.A1]QZT34463.1 TRAP transporter small permease [Caldalkalibacillus thermarum TA2.A1]
MWKLWEKWMKRINGLVENITALFLAVMVLLIFLQIISRAVFQSSFAWTEELARYLMIWVTFLGASFAFQYGAHIGIEVVVNQLSPLLARLVKLCAAIACTVFFIVMIAKGLEIYDRAMIQRSAAMGIPMGYVYTVIPLSGLLMLLNLIDVTLKEWRQDSGQNKTKEGEIG